MPMSETPQEALENDFRDPLSFKNQKKVYESETTTSRILRGSPGVPRMANDVFAHRLATVPEGTLTDAASSQPCRCSKELSRLGLEEKVVDLLLWWVEDV